ncbi:hypothetical protein SEA_SHAM_84 [Streptomyces phage Sham]|nr:hypothetical protein SEA_SHAM_84 [Streptomyces phage Sham]
MSTVEERFDKAVNGVESVLDSLAKLKELGIFGKEEFTAGIVLLTTLERAMKVLDPERTAQYAKEEVEKAIAEAKQNGSLDDIMSQLGNLGGQNTGLYL